MMILHQLNRLLHNLKQNPQLRLPHHHVTKAVIVVTVIAKTIEKVRKM